MSPRYRVEISPVAAKELGSLPKPVQSRIKVKVLALAADPRPSGSTKLVGTRSSWRVRIGDYRVIYEVRDEVLIVLVIKIGHRKQVYLR